MLNILLSSIATRLKLSGGTIADGFAGVTVLFADIVGSTRLPPERIVEVLNEVKGKGQMETWLLDGRLDHVVVAIAAG